MILQITVRNWHQNELTLSAELIDSFVKGVEQQATESILRYEREKKTHVEVAGGDEMYARIVETHGGLESETWDLDEIFEEYFPGLQRRSALLTVWGYFEHELDKLCALYKAEKNFALDLSDLNGKGIDRATTYLEKVAGLDMHKGSQEWQLLRKIQQLRNIVAHQDGKLQDRSGNPIKPVVAFINETDSLAGNGEVTINAGFLGIVVEAFKAYFALIAASIAAKEQP